jgi:hypothetical protein
VLNIPADPTWEPMRMSDTLDKDGYYAAKIIEEKLRVDDGKNQVIMTLEILDQDAMGKIVSKFMPDAASTAKNTWFLWRGLMRSIGGGDSGKSAFQYTLGALKTMGAVVYFKSEPYVSKDGSVSTSVADWVTRAEYEEAVRSNRHRWVSKMPQQMGGAGALPGGVPGFGGGMPGLPGAPGGMPGGPAFPGLPGAPGGAVPQPAGVPMQAQPPAMQYQPPMVPPAAGPPPGPPAGAPAFAPPAFAPPAFAPQAPAASAFAPTAAPQAPPPNPFAPAGGNGVPQPPPTAAGLSAAFPGLPGQPR